MLEPLKNERPFSEFLLVVTGKHFNATEQSFSFCVNGSFETGPRPNTNLPPDSPPLLIQAWVANVKNVI